MSLSIETFQQADIRAGTIADARDFSEARAPAYKLTIDFGPEIGRLQSSAQLKARYTEADLVGRQVMAVVNLPPKKVAGFVSECLVLGFADAEGAIVLAQAERPVPDGARMH